MKGRDDHPVVPVAYADAEAYAAWTGGTLPTEGEWMFRPAARFPERIETSTCHPGFRGIVRPPSAARSEVDRQSS